MAKIKAIPDGDELEFFFNSSDHMPEHFHVKHSGGRWEIRVYIKTSSDTHLDYDFKFPKNSTSIPAKFRDLILEKMKGKEVELLKEWEEKVKT